MATRIKIQPPEKLPIDGITATQFKAWKTSLIIYLKQNSDFRRFMQGGIYAAWESADENPVRIDGLHANDQPPADGDENVDDRLTERQTQLETFLSIIAGVVNTSQHNDVMVRSVSLESVWDMLESDFDIQKQGRHFMKIDTIKYDKNGGETVNAFYKRLRNFFSDNLRKTGELVKS